MNGKGSGRRPSAVSKREADENWERTFGGALKENEQNFSLPDGCVMKTFGSQGYAWYLPKIIKGEDPSSTVHEP